MRDPGAKAREDALTYIEENVDDYAKVIGLSPGSAKACESFDDAVKDAWLVFEAVPEKLQIKIDTFADLEAKAPRDCILGSNSSSYKSSEMLERVDDDSKTRILNTHYMMPPANRVVVSRPDW